ncbi:unnamed protein product [Amoebophrya sp. A25]|nr:unnamed protein product [Amoebophrya sp. A25]|eukprot:GSA25T00005116001.1
MSCCCGGSSASNAPPENTEPPTISVTPPRRNSRDGATAGINDASGGSGRAESENETFYSAGSDGKDSPNRRRKSLMAAATNYLARRLSNFRDRKVEEDFGMGPDPKRKKRRGRQKVFRTALNTVLGRGKFMRKKMSKEDLDERDRNWHIMQEKRLADGNPNKLTDYVWLQSLLNALSADPLGVDADELTKGCAAGQFPLFVFAGACPSSITRSMQAILFVYKMPSTSGGMLPRISKKRKSATQSGSIDFWWIKPKYDGGKSGKIYCDMDLEFMQKHTSGKAKNACGGQVKGGYEQIADYFLKNKVSGDGQFRFGIEMVYRKDGSVIPRAYVEKVKPTFVSEALGAIDEEDDENRGDDAGRLSSSKESGAARATTATMTDQGRDSEVERVHGFSVASEWNPQTLDAESPKLQVLSPLAVRIALDDGNAPGLRTPEYSAASAFSARSALSARPGQPVLATGTPATPGSALVPRKDIVVGVHTAAVPDNLTPQKASSQASDASPSSSQSASTASPPRTPGGRASASRPSAGMDSSGTTMDFSRGYISLIWQENWAAFMGRFIEGRMVYRLREYSEGPNLRSREYHIKGSDPIRLRSDFESVPFEDLWDEGGANIKMMCQGDAWKNVPLVSAAK